MLSILNRRPGKCLEFGANQPISSKSLQSRTRLSGHVSPGISILTSKILT